MADDNYESKLILSGDSKGAEKALDRVHKGLKQTEDANRRVAREAQKASLLYADSMVEAARRVESEHRRTIESLKRITDGYRQARAEAGKVGGSGGGAGGALKSGALDIAREIGGGSPFAPLLEGAAEFTRGAIIAGGAAAAAGLAWQKLQEAIEASRQAAQERAKVVLDNAAIETEATRLLRDNQYAAAKALADSQLAEQTRLQGDIQRLEGLRDAAQAEHDATADLARKLLARTDIDEYTRQIEEKRQEFNATSEKVVSAYTVLNSELGTAAQQTEKFKSAMADFVEVDQERQRVADQTAAAIAALTKQEQALNQAYTQSAVARSAARGLADSREKQDRDIAAARAQEDLDAELARQEAAHQANLLAITQRGQDAIAAAYADINSAITRAAESAAAAQAQYDQAAIEAQREFDKERLRAQREFRQALERLEDEYNKRRFGAILDNDVLAFLEAQSGFKSDRRNLRSDRRDERADARQDFDDERAKEKAAHEARLTEIETELAEYIKAQAVKIADIQAKTEQELALAKAAYDEQLRLDQQRRDLIESREAADLKLKLDRRAEDRRIEDGQARAALQAALDRISEQKDAQNAALDEITLKARQLQQIAASIQFPTPTGSAGVSVPVPSSGSTYTPTPGSEKFYEDPRQGRAGGGNFGAGLNSVSSAGAARGGAPNVQFNITSAGAIGGREVAFIEDVQREVVKALTQYHAMLVNELGTEEGRRG